MLVSGLLDSIGFDKAYLGVERSGVILVEDKSDLLLFVGVRRFVIEVASKRWPLRPMGLNIGVPLYRELFILLKKMLESQLVNLK